MLLIPKNHKLPPLYATNNDPDPIVHIKLFTPDSSFTWYLLEYSPELGIVYVYVTSYMCPEGEHGYVSLEEMQELRGPLNLPIERDLHFDPTRIQQIVKSVRKSLN